MKRYKPSEKMPDKQKQFVICFGPKNWFTAWYDPDQKMFFNVADDGVIMWIPTMGVEWWCDPMEDLEK